MTRIDALKGCALAVVAMALAACGNDQAQEAAAYDAAFVAAQADKGNLVPLKTLVDACHAEVKRQGRRDAVCEVLDAVGPLRKPLNIRF
ncbi:hypothetical protein ACSFBX_30320 [Variovorax sp. RB2P76]|uniref:hypothetical protein n=1 Tax=Variovorax sp. RB2P76 TaxID=3443736 RepID=UPI003F45494C